MADLPPRPPDPGRSFVVLNPPHPDAGPAGDFFQLRLGLYGSDRVSVLSFKGREEVSRPYKFDVLASIVGIDADELESSVLGQQACLSLRVGPIPRAIHGIVASTSLTGINQHGRLTFRVRLVPRLQRLEAAGLLRPDDPASSEGG